MDQDQEDPELQQRYLEALARIDAKAADVAFELGLNLLGMAIRENVSDIERQLLALADARRAAEERERGWVRKGL